MIIHLDNSAFNLLSCEFRFQQRVINGRVEPKGTGAAFGDAVHKAIEFHDNGFDNLSVMNKLLEAGYSSIPKVMQVASFIFATKTYPPPILINNKPAIEVKFSYKYASFILPGSGELVEIYLDGTIDRIHIDQDILVLQDYKTTAECTAYGIDKVIKSYSLSFQLPFYFFALLKSGILPASYMDYIENNKYRMDIVLISHTAIPPSIHTYSRHTFPSLTITQTIPQIINSSISRALAIAQLNTPAAKTGFTVYKACDLCGYRPVCLADGTPREAEILSYYTVKPYDPLTFR